MNKISVLAITDKKKRDIKEYEDFGIYSRIIVKNTKRSLNKALKKYKSETVIISNDSLNKPILCEKYKPYKSFSEEKALEIIEKVCREVALQHSLEIPLEDIYIYARPETACKYIKRLSGLGRVYTIVTDMEDGSVVDELYFEYGCITRTVRKPNLQNTNDSIALFVETRGALTIPIINIKNEEIIGENVTDIWNISVFDDSITDLSKVISAKSGLSLYTLLGKSIPSNAAININKKSDTIFLLDTNAF